MKSKDIKPFIEKLLTSDKPQCLLIDGPFGCGKTTEALILSNHLDVAKNYIKSESNEFRRVYYLPASGFDSVGEMKDTLLEIQNHAAKKIAGSVVTIFTVVTKAALSTASSPSLPSLPPEYSDGLAETAIDMAAEKITAWAKKKLKKNSVVIIDDLERLSEKVDFDEMFGFVNELKQSKISVICLAFSYAIKSEERKKQWGRFFEKTFDRVCLIEETDDEIIAKIIQSNDKNLIASVKELFANNYRILERAMALKNEVTKIIEEEAKREKLQLLLAEKEILIHCIVACRTIFENHELTHDNKPMKERDPELFNVHFGKYGERIANNIVYFFSPKKPKYEEVNIQVIRALLNFFLKLDQEAIKNRLLVRKRKKEAKKWMILFNDDELLKTQKDFQTRILNGEIKAEENCGLLTYMNLVNLPNSSFLKQDELEKYASIIAQDKSAYGFLEDEAAFDHSQDHAMKKLFELTSARMREDYDKNLSEDMAKAFGEKDWEGLTRLLEDYVTYRQIYPLPITLEKLTKNHFFMPNINNKPSLDEYQYVNELCKKCFKGDFPKESIKAELESQVAKNGTKMGRCRIDRLISYYKLDDHR